MAGTVQSDVLKPFGPDRLRVFFSTDNNPPSHTGDGSFDLGDLVINTAPAAGGTFAWVCTTAGAGGTAVFKAIAIAA